MEGASSLDYRRHLQDILAERSRKNPNLSLRSFAKLVGLSPSHLSRVFNAKSKLSVDTALQICEALELGSDETQHIRDLVALETSSSTKVRTRILERINKSQVQSTSLDLENFRVVASWEHFAILNLCSTRNFQPDVRDIAKRLGISESLVRSALARLETLGLLDRSNPRAWKKVASLKVNTNDEVSSAAIRRHHSDILAKASEAIEAQSLIEREFESLMISFDMKKMKEAKKDIRAFVDAFYKKFESHKGSEVYNLGVQFFRITQGESHDKT